MSVPASDEKVVYYLAYGSNLAAETFLGKRGIRPLSAINVVVPGLRLRFDLPGIPYAEPCFANSATREEHDGDSELRARAADTFEDTSKLLEGGQLKTQDYHKDRWHKGMVGVVYGLTPSDYAHVIATEGGGAAYKDVLVQCHPLVPGTRMVPDKPITPPIQAHTLFAPTSTEPTNKGGRYHRPDPSYAQPSARYLKLITDGAAEHKLPEEYREYLAQIRPFKITTTYQKIGSVLFLGFWGPIIKPLLQYIGTLADDKGRAPDWAVRLMETVFGVCWLSYDTLFRPVFGDGERTIGEDDRATSRNNALCERMALNPTAASIEWPKVEKSKPL